MTTLAKITAALTAICTLVVIASPFLPLADDHGWLVLIAAMTLGAMTLVLVMAIGQQRRLAEIAARRR